MSRIGIGVLLAALLLVPAPPWAAAANPGGSIATARPWITNISGSFDSAGAPAWWYCRPGIRGYSYTSWNGSSMRRGGVWVHVFKCTRAGALPLSAGDLRLILTEDLRTPGATLAFPSDPRFYYYVKIAPRVRGHAGTYHT